MVAVNFLKAGRFPSVNIVVGAAAGFSPAGDSGLRNDGFRSGGGDLRAFGTCADHAGALFPARRGSGRLFYSLPVAELVRAGFALFTAIAFLPVGFCIVFPVAEAVLMKLDVGIGKEGDVLRYGVDGEESATSDGVICVDNIKGLVSVHIQEEADAGGNGDGASLYAVADVGMVISASH